MKSRLGQGSFRILVTDAYERRWAVTRERVLPVLEAAHIRPYATGDEHRFENGLPCYVMQGSELACPSTPDQRPAEEFLQWYDQEVFMG